MDNQEVFISENPEFLQPEGEVNNCHVIYTSLEEIEARFNDAPLRGLITRIAERFTGRKFQGQYPRRPCEFDYISSECDTYSADAGFFYPSCHQPDRLVTGDSGRGQESDINAEILKPFSDSS